MISLQQSERALRRLKRGGTIPAAQGSLGLTPQERWMNYFKEQHRAVGNPHKLLPARYPNPKAKSPVNHPFNFEQFQGFGLFLKSLERAD